MIDLYCGLGGWAQGGIAEGYYVVGFDIERHDYGTGGYPAQLVLQDVMTIHGRQFKNAALIVASPPCQEYSYMAMPWSIAKQKRREYLDGTRDRKDLTALFDACFRIQREASEAAGHHIPLVVENVRSACEWVGRSRWNYGSFHLWGDVPALMPQTKAIKVPGFRFDGSGKSFQTASVDGLKWGEGQSPGRRFDERPGGNVAAHREGTKNTGGSWFNVGSPGQKELAKNPVHEMAKQAASDDGLKIGGDWFSDPNSTCRRHGSKSKARKAASAAIAKIPFPLSQHIAKYWKPQSEAA